MRAVTTLVVASLCGCLELQTPEREPAVDPSGEDPAEDTAPEPRGLDGRWALVELDVEFFDDPGTYYTTPRRGVLDVDADLAKLDLAYAISSQPDGSGTGFGLEVRGTVEEEGDSWRIRGEGEGFVAGVPFPAEVVFEATCALSLDEVPFDDPGYAVDVLNCRGTQANVGESANRRLTAVFWD